MLSKILEKSTCAKCRFCCSFRRCSLWETPLFSEKTMEKYKDVHFETDVVEEVKFGRMNLLPKYVTEDSEEEAACEFLDCEKGCVLNDEYKPFDCKIWPLRVMKKGSEVVIALTPTCPAVNQVELERVEQLVREDLAEVLFSYAKKNPYVYKEYREGFPVLAVEK